MQEPLYTYTNITLIANMLHNKTSTINNSNIVQILLTVTNIGGCNIWLYKKFDTHG